MSVPSRLRGVPFVAVGLALLANPLYLDPLVCQTCAWTVTPFYFAVAIATGVVCILSGVGTLALPFEYLDRVYLVSGVALAVVASVALYEAAVSAYFVPGGAQPFAYVDRNTFVAAVVAAAFLVGVAIARGSAPLAAGGVVLPVVVAALAGVESVLYAFLATISPAILGIPLVGGLAFALAIGLACVAGVSYGVNSEDPDPGPERPTATRPDPD